MNTPTSNNKRCPILYRKDKYALEILTLENSTFCSDLHSCVFRIPLHHFMQSGAVWSALNLCTIFWEKPAWGKPNSLEQEKTKGAYLIAFATNLAPICKTWANDCIQKTIAYQKLGDEVFVEIIVHDQTLKPKLISALQAHVLTFSENENIYTVQ